MASLNVASGETDFPRIPHYYTVNSGVSPEEENLVAATLVLVPVHYAFVCDPQDAQLATRLNVPKILHVTTEQAAVILAQEVFEIEGVRSIVLRPQSEPLTAQYKENSDSYTN